MPASLVVTEDIHSATDISGQVDRDPVLHPNLTVRWNFDQTDIVDYHVYVKSSDEQDYNYLGRTGDAEREFLDWSQNSPDIAFQYLEGPRFGVEYKFIVFALTGNGVPPFYGPLMNENPVVLLPALTVLDSPAAPAALPQNRDQDVWYDRALTLRWNLEYEGIDLTDIADLHIYVQQNDQDGMDYLGRTGNGETNEFTWQSTSASISAAFKPGPQFGDRYRFYLFALTHSGNPLFYGPWSSETIEYESKVIVTDTIHRVEDLSNGIDTDPLGGRDLVIQWRHSFMDVLDYHVYVRVDQSSEYQFLGNTGSGTAQRFVWIPGAAYVAPEFREGPQFYHMYEFHLYAILDTVAGAGESFRGPFGNDGPVRFLPFQP